MAPKYVLTYFDIPGRAEAARLMFTLAGVEFTDQRLQFQDWPALKQDVKKFPLGVLPTLQVDDLTICQSAAIYKFLAREFNLYGANTVEQTIVDQLVETTKDVLEKVVKIKFTPGLTPEQKSEKVGEVFKEDSTKKGLDFISSFLKKSTSGFFLEKVSTADILFAVGYSLIVELNSAFCSDHPELKALVEKFYALEEVKKYYDAKK